MPGDPVSGEKITKEPVLESITFESVEDFARWIETVETDDLLSGDAQLGEKFPRSVSIRLKGELFNRSITPTIMEGILSLQRAINAMYRIGTESSRLTKEEKGKLELIVVVDEGSSLINVDFGNAIQLLKKMNGKHVTIGIALLISGMVGLRWIDQHYDTTRARITANQEVVASEERTKALGRVLDTLDRAVDGLRQSNLRLSSSGAEEIGLNGIDVSPEELSRLSRATRIQPEVVLRVIDGHFRVERLDFSDPEETYMDLIHIETGNAIRRVALQKQILRQNDFQILQESVEREPVGLRLVVTYRNSEVQEARFDSLLSE